MWLIKRRNRSVSTQFLGGTSESRVARKPDFQIIRYCHQNFVGKSAEVALCVCGLIRVVIIWEGCLDPIAFRSTYVNVSEGVPDCNSLASLMIRSSLCDGRIV